MAFTEKKSSSDVDVIHDLQKEGKTLTGVYQGADVFDGKRPGQKVTIHLIQQGDKTEGFYGAKDLDKKLEGEVGKTVKVAFSHKKDLPGGRTFKVYKVEIDSTK